MIEHMHRGGITREVAEKLLEAFRRSPGHARLAARAAGIDHRTARKAWERGWPHQPHAARPMREVIAEEQEAARALRDQQGAEVLRRAAELEAAELVARRTQAARDAATTRAAEAVMVKLGRSAAIELVGSLASINKATERLASSVSRRLREEDDSAPASVGELHEVVGLARSLAEAVAQVTSSAHTLLEMERQIVGEPHQFHSPAAPTPVVTMEEAERRIEAASRALARAKARSSGADRG